MSSAGLQVLCVSQFTLHATTRKPKPSYSRAMPADAARVLFEAFVAEMRRELGGDGSRVATGAFREMMSVSLVNDGPVTFMIDSWNKDGTCFGAPEGVGEDGGDEGETPTPTPTTATATVACAAAPAVGGAAVAAGASSTPAVDEAVGGTAAAVAAAAAVAPPQPASGSS